MSVVLHNFINNRPCVRSLRTSTDSNTGPISALSTPRTVITYEQEGVPLPPWLNPKIELREQKRIIVYKGHHKTFSRTVLLHHGSHLSKILIREIRPHFVQVFLNGLVCIIAKTSSLKATKTCFMKYLSSLFLTVKYMDKRNIETKC